MVLRGMTSIVAAAVAVACSGTAVVDGGGGAGATTGTGSTAGTGGTPTGGSGAGSPGCPPQPHCNWCGGTAVTDANGCVVGYRCANGIDPCETSACQTNYDCGPDEYCAEDGLCWRCEGETCQVGGSGSDQICRCAGSCADGATISFECTTSEYGGNCDCYVNGDMVSVCDIDGYPEDPCLIGFQCCNWPGEWY